MPKMSKKLKAEFDRKEYLKYCNASHLHLAEHLKRLARPWWHVNLRQKDFSYQQVVHALNLPDTVEMLTHMFDFYIEHNPLLKNAVNCTELAVLKTILALQHLSGDTLPIYSIFIVKYPDDSERIFTLRPGEIYYDVKRKPKTG